MILYVIRVNGFQNNLAKLCTYTNSTGVALNLVVSGYMQHFGAGVCSSFEDIHGHSHKIKAHHD